MIVFKKFGLTFKIRNDDWKSLRERFNPANAILESKRYFTIRVECPVCKNHDDCGDCPFGRDNQSCFSFLRRLFRDRKFGVANSFVCWSIKKNKQARRQLQRLQRMMDKIEEQNRKGVSNV